MATPVYLCMLLGLFALAFNFETILSASRRALKSLMHEFACDHVTELRQARVRKKVTRNRETSRRFVKTEQGH